MFFSAGTREVPELAPIQEQITLLGPYLASVIAETLKRVGVGLVEMQEIRIESNDLMHGRDRLKQPLERRTNERTCPEGFVGTRLQLEQT